MKSRSAVLFRSRTPVNYRQACVSADNDRISDFDLVIVIVITADVLKNFSVDIDRAEIVAPYIVKKVLFAVGRTDAVGLFVGQNVKLLFGILFRPAFLFLGHDSIAGGDVLLFQLSFQHPQKHKHKNTACGERFSAV